MTSKKKLSVVVTAIVLLLGLLSSSWMACEAGNRTTGFPASDRPDQVCLTWRDDPCTTQSVQWRTAPAVADGVVHYRKKDEPETASREAAAAYTTLTDPLIANDPSAHHFTATMTGLDPATTYTYRVGSGPDNPWSEWADFTTAPQGRTSFSFIYMGDVQNGLDTWGRLLHRAFEGHPNAAFCILAGDLVNRGNMRDDWDGFFQAATGVFDRRPVVPALGNHDCAGLTGPRLYLDLFALPENGPENVPRERVYDFHYGNALVIVLDSNTPPKQQRSWLQEQLAGSDAPWKFVVYHHPAYSSGPHRDNPQVREQWCDLFDRYHVDMVFQGHDHAYLRTFPMKAGHVVDSPSEGTIYVVADSGTKFYKQEHHEYTAVGMTDVSTYQVIDIQADDVNRLTYRAYDMDGKVRDEVIIAK